MTEARFAYKRSHWTRDLCFALFICGIGLFLGWLAITNDRGLIIEDVIVLSPARATIFYWVLGAFMVVLGLYLASSTLGDAIVGRRDTIELTSESIIVPVFGWSARELSIAYDDIVDVSIGQYPNPFRSQEDRSKSSHFRILTIVHRGGKYQIVLDYLPDQESFDTIYEMLMARVGSAGHEDC